VFYFHFTSHLLGILRLSIIFFYVHTFDDAWYVEICSSKPLTGSIYKPPTIYKEAIQLNRVPSFSLTPRRICSFFFVHVWPM
jgi:hypothetical protein